jgi:hypothetical protein
MNIISLYSNTTELFIKAINDFNKLNISQRYAIIDEGVYDNCNKIGSSPVFILKDVVSIIHHEDHLTIELNTGDTVLLLGARYEQSC